MFKAIISAFISGVIQRLLSVFGLSDQQKLGRAETKLTADETLIQDAQDAKKIHDAISASTGNDSDDWLHQHYKG